MKQAGFKFPVAGILISLFLIFSCEKETPEENKMPDFQEIKSFRINNKGEKLLATNIGLIMFDGKKWTAIPLEDELNFSINQIDLNPDGNTENLWLGTDFGLLNYTADSILNIKNSLMPDEQVKHFFIDGKKNVFLTTPSGVLIYSANSWIVTTGVDDLFLNFKATGIKSASNNFTYVATQGGGVGRFKYDVDGISGATVFNSDWTRMETNDINNLFIDDTIQWYATNAGVAVHYSEFTKWDWEIYTTENGLLSDTVLSIAKDLDGNMWFGTFRGLSKFDGESWNSYTVDSHKIINDTVRFIDIDPDGSVWIASPSGLSQFKDDNWINHSK